MEAISLFPKTLLQIQSKDDTNKRSLLQGIVGDHFEPFEKSSTKDRDFWTSSTKKITVPTMQKTDTYNYVQNDDAQILEIPYKGERFSMLIALPLQRDGIEDLENALKSDTFVNWRKSMNATYVEVYMPKFEINTEYSDVLKNTLKDLGVEDSFAPGADFSKLSNDPLHISKLVQKAYVADEKADVKSR